MNNNEKTLYEILGFSKNGYNDNGEKVSFESIERAKNRLLYGDNIEGSVPFWMHENINRAYTILSNPTTRREYDETLLTHDVSYSSNDTSVTEESVVIKPIEGEQSIVEPQEERTVDKTNEEEYDEAVVDLNEYYSNSKEPTQEKPVQEEPKPVEQKPTEPKLEDYIIPIYQKEKKPAKELTKKQKRILYGVSFALTGIPGPIIVYFAMKIAGKKKLHPNKNKKISEIKTQESNLIKEYNEKIDQEINTLLAKQNNNYNLQISKIRYENQIKLLRKRLELKLNEKVTGKNLLKYKLEYIALKNQLERAEQRLEKMNKKINDYEGKDKTRNLLSNSLNKKLYETAEEIQKLEKGNKSLSIKKLNVRKGYWQKARDFSVKRLKLSRNIVGRVQDGIIRAWDNVRSVKEIFTPYDKIAEYTPQQENSKTL